MPKLKKIFSTLVIASNLLMNFSAGGVALAAPAKSPVTPPPVVTPKYSTPPPAPDWVNVDWEGEIVLPADAEAAAKTRQKLAEEGKAAEAKAVAPVKRKMTDDEVLNAARAPTEVRQKVEEYRERAKEAKGDGDLLKTAAVSLRAGLRQLFPGQVNNDQKSAEAEKAERIDLRVAKKIYPMKTEGIIQAKPVKIEKVKIIEASAGGKALRNATLRQLKKAADNKEFIEPGKEAAQPVSQGWWKRWVAFFSPAAARAATPLISYSAGIENKPLDYALYYLSNQQNNDGSFGLENNYEVTAQVLYVLTDTGRVDNDQYAMASQL